MMALENMKKSSRNNLCKVLILLVLIILLFLTPTLAQYSVRVKRAIDGDTLLLTSGERVRLIGVDTPETKHPQKPVQYFGKEAYLFIKGMVEGKEVRLEFDWQK